MHDGPDSTYELVVEQEIKQTHQFALLKPLPKIDNPPGREDVQYDTLMRSTDVIDGRPTLDDLIKARADGFNHCWLYTKIEDRPELVDSISL